MMIDPATPTPFEKKRTCAANATQERKVPGVGGTVPRIETKLAFILMGLRFPILELRR